MKKNISVLSLSLLGLIATSSVQAQEFNKVSDSCYQSIEQINSEDLKSCLAQFQSLVVQQQYYIQQVFPSNLSDPKMDNLSDPKMLPDPNLSDPKMIEESNLSDPKM